MAEIEVKNLANETVGTLELSDKVFKAEPNPPLVWEAVQYHLAAQRAGTAATKTRGRVSGSGKKLWRQKGTGRARIGSIRSPLWRHGGTVHGPQPRDYAYSFPRKKLRGAMRAALSAKLEEKCIQVVDAFNLDSHKTKDLRRLLEGLGARRKVLLVDTGDNRNLRLSSRNLPAVKLVAGNVLNIYDVVDSQQLIFSREAILQVQEVLCR